LEVVVTHDSITVVGLSTGVVLTQERIVNSIAFDLSEVDLREHEIVSATLHLGPLSPESKVVLTDPSAQAEYGRATCRRSDHSAQIRLTSEAVRDLRGAGGSFFSMSTVVCDPEGVPHRLSSTGTHVLALLLAHANRSRLAPESRAAA